MEGGPHRHHEDHIAGKGMTSLSHYILVHKFIPMPQAMKIPDAKAAVDKEEERIVAKSKTDGNGLVFNCFGEFLIRERSDCIKKSGDTQSSREI